MRPPGGWTRPARRSVSCRSSATASPWTSSTGWPEPSTPSSPCRSTSKKQYRVPGANRGYSPPKSESLSLSLGIESASRMNDFFEAFNVGAEARSFPHLDLSEDDYGINLWPGHRRLPRRDRGLLRGGRPGRARPHHGLRRRARPARRLLRPPHRPLGRRPAHEQLRPARGQRHPRRRPHRHERAHRLRHRHRAVGRPGARPAGPRQPTTPGTTSPPSTAPSWSTSATSPPASPTTAGCPPSTGSSHRSSTTPSSAGVPWPSSTTATSTPSSPPCRTSSTPARPRPTSRSLVRDHIKAKLAGSRQGKANIAATREASRVRGARPSTASQQ